MLTKKQIKSLKPGDQLIIINTDCIKKTIKGIDSAIKSGFNMKRLPNPETTIVTFDRWRGQYITDEGYTIYYFNIKETIYILNSECVSIAEEKIIDDVKNISDNIKNKYC